MVFRLPVPRDVSIPSVPYYLIGGKVIEHDRYQCVEEDNKDGYTNILCTNLAGEYYTNKINCSELQCSEFISCSDIPPKFCEYPVTLYTGDSAEGLSAVDVCRLDTTGSMCIPLSRRTPKRISNESQAVSPLWVVTDSSYSLYTVHSCDVGKDDVNGYVNALCSNGEMEVVPDQQVYCEDPVNHHIVSESSWRNSDKVYNCAFTSCETMPVSLCRHEDVDLYYIDNVTNDIKLSASCTYDPSKTKCDVKSRPTGIKFVRPTYRPSTSRAHTWYVGHYSYMNNIRYVCSDVDDIQGYQNVLCLDDTGLFKSMEVVCKDVAAPNPFSVFDFERIGSNKRLEGSTVRHDCTADECVSLSIDLCGDVIDLYGQTVSGDVHYINPCILNKTETQCEVSTPEPTLDIRRPTTRHKERRYEANWWYVGSDSYYMISYACGRQDAVDDGYLNVMCDEEQSGKLRDGYVDCADPNHEETEYVNDYRNCRARDCYDLPPRLCRKPLDLYRDDGSDLRYVDTCAVGNHSCISLSRIPDTPSPSIVTTDSHSGFIEIVMGFHLMTCLL